MSQPLRLAIMGAGLIGKQHARRIASRTDAVLSAIIDPAEDGKRLAAELGTSWFADFSDLRADQRPDGVLIATPNQFHLEHALACLEAGIPILVEKPLAADLPSAQRLVEVTRSTGVPVLVGHHRRHSSTLRKARALLDKKELGNIITVNALFWLYKPDPYFKAAAWRTKRGAGPVFLNLIHDIDSLRYLLGDIVSVRAQLSNLGRGNEIEDTAAIIAEFKSGTLGTFSVSDAVAAPWSWEMTSGENPAYPRTPEACYLLGGTHGSLAVPNLVKWHYGETRGWWEPLEHAGIKAPDVDPLVAQLDHWCAVLRGETTPLVTAEDGLANIAVVDAIYRAAQSGGTERVS